MKKLAAILLVLVLCVSACAYADENWTCPNCREAANGDFCANCGEKSPYAVQEGDTVTFGTYAGEPIEWQVLEVKEDGVYVLLSVKGLDAKPYHTELENVTWETCSLRAWLNGEFYEKAFSESEKSKIVLSTVENPDDTTYGTKGGNTTKDYVYLLSLDEVGRYFNVDPYTKKSAERSAETLICMPTQTAVQNGAYTLGEEDAKDYQPYFGYPLKTGACRWWLRSPGCNQDYAAFGNDRGVVGSRGYYVNGADECVLPVVCVRF